MSRQGTVPYHEVDTHDTLRLLGAAVVDDGALSLDPGVAASPRQEPVLVGHCLTAGKHCNNDHQQ